MGAGEIVSHAIGEGETMVHYLSGFHRSRNRLAWQERVGMGRDGGQRGRRICHAMMSGEWSKPVTSPPAQGNHLSCMVRDREGRGGTGCKRRTGKAKAGRKAKASTGQRDSLRDNAHGPPHHTGGRSTLLYGTAASLREYPISSFI
jgi:hypothetical protein